MNNEKLDDSLKSGSQANIILAVFLFLLISLIFIFSQKYNSVRSLLIHGYLDTFNNQVSKLDNSVGNVVEHVSMMQSIAEGCLAEDYSSIQVERNIDQIRNISAFNKKKKYHIYKFGEIISHHKIISTIIASENGYRC